MCCKGKVLTQKKRDHGFATCSLLLGPIDSNENNPAINGQIVLGKKTVTTTFKVIQGTDMLPLFRFRCIAHSNCRHV